MKIILLSGAMMAFGAVGFLSLTNKPDKISKTVPVYYMHSHNSSQPKALWQEPPTINQIKKDLNGKSIQISGVAHTFQTSELNYVSVANINGDDVSTVIDVQINSDVTLIQKYGVFGMRQNQNHQNVSGTIRINYERIGDVWVFKSIENIDARKKIFPKIN